MRFDLFECSFDYLIFYHFLWYFSRFIWHNKYKIIKKSRIKPSIILKKLTSKSFYCYNLSHSHLQFQFFFLFQMFVFFFVCIKKLASNVMKSFKLMFVCLFSVFFVCLFIYLLLYWMWLISNDFIYRFVYMCTNVGKLETI